MHSTSLIVGLNPSIKYLLGGITNRLGACELLANRQHGIPRDNYPLHILLIYFIASITDLCIDLSMHITLLIVGVCQVSEKQQSERS